ncbi:MAG: signal peptidase II [Deltaproteobacteria bacterium]|nr:signal peptidase II [Deltaproteobacteria bacterium]
MSDMAWYKTVKFKWMMAMAIIWLVVDQVTKIWVVNNIAYRSKGITVIDGFFDIVHAQNSGAAMGFLNDYEHRMLVFAVFTVIALGVLAQMYREIPADDRFQSIALGLVFSGAIGNAIDRIHKQSVTDFLRVYTEHETLKPWLAENIGWTEWPSFNVADAAIVVGLGMFIWFFAFLQEDEDELEPEPPESPVDINA